MSRCPRRSAKGLGRTADPARCHPPGGLHPSAPPADGVASCPPPAQRDEPSVTAEAIITGARDKAARRRGS
jgi:hypothetical protein